MDWMKIWEIALAVGDAIAKGTRKRREKEEYRAADSMIIAAREVYWAPWVSPRARLICARHISKRMTIIMVTRMLSDSESVKYGIVQFIVLSSNGLVDEIWRSHIRPIAEKTVVHVYPFLLPRQAEVLGCDIEHHTSCFTSSLILCSHIYDRSVWRALSFWPPSDRRELLCILVNVEYSHVL